MERNKIISIVNQKGGVGKTTTTLNMSAWFSMFAKCKVLIIDGDGQANLTTCLNIDMAKVKGTLYDLLTNEDLKAQDIIYQDSNLLCDVIIADERLNDIDIVLSTAFDRERILQYKLEEIRANYDYIIIDCSPALNLTTYNALVASDYLLIPVQSDFLAVRGTANMVDLIKNKVQKRLNPKLEILGLFLTMYDNRITTDKSIKDLLKEEFGDKALEVCIRENSKVKDSPMYKKSIFEYDRNSNGCVDYYNLMIELWQRLGGSVNNERK